MSLTNQLMIDMKLAMKGHDKTSLSVIRMLKSGLMNKKIELGHELTAAEEAQVVASQMKQQKDSLAQFIQGQRQDLVDQTKAQMAVLEKYMPQQLSADEVQQFVNQKAQELQATTKADFGRLMKAVMPELKGKADGQLVNKIVKELLK
ncbi:GatB/YqeY domain-containing protein [Lactobacillus sp. DCY120]|uniref:GatB/YqeY domain-containing protein n=1 Tax=Bombilactobacillus apium TaxID=2675299 RepID=A0A850QVM7_9LACO|nr:GatB/YqeY domain-containing protein [Bombilactobacillus apium]NVY95844.1 GatB/YqeY domain-containing protein [Bombilactobacillus apium]